MTLVRIYMDNLRPSPALRAWAERALRACLRRFGGRMRRVDVRFEELAATGRRAGARRCAIEVRLSGGAVLAVEHRAGDLYAAAGGAARRLRRALARAVGRAAARQRRTARPSRRSRGAGDAHGGEGRAACGQ